MRYIIYLLCFISFGSSAQQISVRDQVEKTYLSQLHVREKTGNNDGVDVEKYLSYVWLKKGQPWCAAFVSWTCAQNGITKARSGGCVQLMEQGKTIYKNGKVIQLPQKSDIFFIYYSEKKRVAHTGLIQKWGDMVATVEGNTNGAGSREGNGVYKKWRQRIQIYAVNDLMSYKK